MFKIAVIIFRESLEVALLLGVILAATKPIASARLYTMLGLLIGFISAMIFAYIVFHISYILGDLGDELFNCGIILVTSFTISLTVVWMQGYTKKIHNNINYLSQNLDAGANGKLMLVVVVASAIVREGIEIILFIYSIFTLSNTSSQELILGIALGAALGFLTGLVIYLGFIKYAGKYIFQASSTLLILIAAGLAAEAAGILTSAGVIQACSTTLWDTSWLANSNSFVGKVLNASIGYDPRPNGMQIIFYTLSILLTYLIIKMRKTTRKSHCRAD